MSSQETAHRKRLLFIDMFRGLAVVAMIQAHVSNATILNSIQKTTAFHYLDIFNGTISGCFIFIAGFAIVLYLDTRWDDVRTGGRALWKQMRRLAFVWFIGYWLHVPVWSLRGMLRMDAAHTLRFLRVDVLMLISVSLVILLLLSLLTKTRKAHRLCSLALGLGVIFATPFVYDINPSDYLPLALSGYVNSHPSNTALFPLFPFSAYAFLGAYLSWVYLDLSKKDRAYRLFRGLLIGGIVMTASAFALFYLPWSLHEYRDVAKASPRSFLMRFGVVVFLLSATWYYENWRKPVKSFLAVLGQESLFVYAFHLLIVYGSVFTPYHLSWNVGRTLTYSPSFALSAALILFVSGITWVWHNIKIRWPRAGRVLFYAFWLYYALVFLLRP